MNVLKDFLTQMAIIATIVSISQIFNAGRRSDKPRSNVILSAAMGLAILLCMSFPAYMAQGIRLDIRIVPLLLGTLYGGTGAGLALSALIVLYRWFMGMDAGFYTTLLTLVFSMPAILYVRKRFFSAAGRMRIDIAAALAMFYCVVGLIVVTVVRGFSMHTLQMHGIHAAIIVGSVLVFTALSETINDMLRRNQQLQAETKDAEIAFLRSQIKPHFLYNTLNSIATLCLKDPRKAEELTLEFSQYLRKSFAFDRLDSLTSVAHELELVRAYLNVEKARFGARLVVEYDVDSVRPHTPIPPLILQPLVENAVRHGLMSTLRGGKVTISAVQHPDNEITIAVEDDGCGMSAEELEAVRKRKTKGVGLRNIGERLELLYGRSLRIESAEGVGTKVVFRIPAGTSGSTGG
ncbi:sensor histidine kinase [Cohnella cellulosilytica]